jgi:hypothetical protein
MLVEVSGGGGQLGGFGFADGPCGARTQHIQRHSFHNCGQPRCAGRSCSFTGHLSFVPLRHSNDGRNTANATRKLTRP